LAQKKPVCFVFGYCQGERKRISRERTAGERRERGGAEREVGARLD